MVQSGSVHKGWHSRGYLPHFDNPGLTQMLTWRLADSMPADKVAYWKDLLRNKEDRPAWVKVEKYLDAGHGSCVLEDFDIALVVEEALLHFDVQRYRLLAWVIMPNHVHAMIDTFEGHPVGRIVHSWKSYTAHRIDSRIGHVGRLWQPDYFDRYVRSEKHLQFGINYIHNNPVKAGLVSEPVDWCFSSARKWSDILWSAGVSPAAGGL